MPEIVCVLSELSGKISRAKKGKEELKRGDLCIIESELGGDLAMVIDDSSQVCAHQKAVKDAVNVIRLATDWLRKRTRKNSSG